MSPLSPLDGRYRKDTEALEPFFSEEALLRGRIAVELLYFEALAEEQGVRELKRLKSSQKRALEKIRRNVTERDLQAIRALEARTRHDVKAVELLLRGKIERIPGLRHAPEFVHFALTSEDVNNLAYGILIHGTLRDVVRPELRRLHTVLRNMGTRWRNLPLLSLTHGQPATPTTLGKEMRVFADRLERQRRQLGEFRMQGKFGGAVGTYGAHEAAYPEVDWRRFGKRFVQSLGLDPLSATTQINPHDDLAELSHTMIRINTILLDLSRDLWLYVSRGVFAQRPVRGEVGSSTMPHKVNPIDFENAEGNLGLSTALFDHFALKLPVSRLQRDLSDSTVQRNIGTAFGHHLLAVRSELREHPEILAEAIQTVLRRHGVRGAYDKLKTLTRGRSIDRRDLLKFIETLEIPASDRQRLAKMCR
jgi:adenylosuccinate lyase